MNPKQNPFANVDAQELDKFAAHAHLWWDKKAKPYAALHAINPLRLRWIEAHVPLNGKSVLDVGCGGGILTQSIAERNAASVLGIDLAEASLEAARQQALERGSQNLTYQCLAVEALADQATTSGLRYDVVTCMEMLEHVPDPQSIVRACARVLKPGGWCFFSTLNRTLKAFAQAIVAAEYLLGLVPKGTHSYLRFIKPSELSSWARAEGLELIAIRGLTYHPLTRRYALVDDPSVNYLVALRKP